MEKSNSFSVSSVLKHGNIDYLDIPKELCTLINTVKNDATTWDDVMEGLRDYIWQKRLFDPQQMKVLCKGDALAKIVGVEEFTILEIKQLLQGFVFRLHSNKDNPPETMCKDTSPIPFRETAKRKAEEMFEGGAKATEKRHCEQVECSETLSCAHIKSLESPMLLHIPPSPPIDTDIPSDSCESVQCVETSFVTDSSDDSIFFEDSTDKGHFLSSGSIFSIAQTFEVEFEPNDSGSDSLYSDSDSSGWDSIMDLDSIISFVCKTDEDKEFWADKSSDDDPEFWGEKSSDEDFRRDAEISEFDLWRCSKCKRLNHPPNRFCCQCFGTREGWLPEKSLSEKMPHPKKRKPRSKRRKRLRHDSAKYFKKDSSHPIDLPSTSQESASHEDFNSDKNEIFLSPFLKIREHKNLDNKKRCLFCCDKAVDSCIIHGRIAHSIGCFTCSKRFKRCPICRRLIEKVVYLIS